MNDEGDAMIITLSNKLKNIRRNSAYGSRNTDIHRSVTITHHDRAEIGHHIYLGPSGFYDSSGGLKIKDGAIFSSFVKVLTSSHVIGDGTVLPYSLENEHKSVEIGYGVWVGLSAIIMPGVTLGDGVIVGAGSVVTKSFPKGSIIAGNPAKVIRMREVSQDAIKNSQYKVRLKKLPLNG